MSRKHRKRHTYEALGLDGRTYRGFYYRDKDGQYIGERVDDDLIDAILHEVDPETIQIVGGKEDEFTEQVI